MTSIQNPEILLRVSNECFYSQYKITNNQDILNLLAENIIQNIMTKTKKKCTIINDLNLFDYCDYCTKKIHKKKFYNESDKTYYTDSMVKISFGKIEFYIYSIGNLNYFSDIKESSRDFMVESLKEKILSSVYFESKNELVTRQYVTKEFTELISKRLEKYISKIK